MNSATFERQLPACLPQLRALAKRMVGNRDDAEDIVQDALLRASKSLATFHETSALGTWLFAITTRTAIDHLRARKRWSPQAMVDACDVRGRDTVLAKYADPSIAFDVGQHISFCFTCIGRSLEPASYAALALCEVFHLTNVEAAAALELTEPQLRHALSAAREQMRTAYEGLCALVNKNGACYQCRVLRELAPGERQGPPLPKEPLPFDERLSTVVAAQTAAVDQRLNDYFFATVRAMQAASSE